MSGASDALQNAAANILMTALHAAEAGGEWLKGQIPDVLHQLLVWNIADDLVWLFVWGIPITLFIWLLTDFTRAYGKQMNEYKGPGSFDLDDLEYSGPKAVLLGVSGLMCVGAIPGFIAITLDLLETVIAPKVWLLEYAHHLLSH